MNEFERVMLLKKLSEIKKVADDFTIPEQDALITIQMNLNVLIQNIKNGYLK